MVNSLSDLIKVISSEPVPVIQGPCIGGLTLGDLFHRAQYDIELKSNEIID